jgi:UDP-N-acetylmuramate dehydrogenase
MKTKGIEIRENYPLGEHTTFGIGGPARYFTVVESEDEVVEALDFAKERNIPIFTLGGGSNVLISDAGFDGLVILDRIKGFKSRIEDKDAIVYAGAGEDWQHFADRCISSGWQGIECLAGIPGTVGASPVQNIGAYGQDVSQIVAGVRAIESETGKSIFFSNAECGFGYRKSIFNGDSAGKYLITGVTFRLKQDGAPAMQYRELKKYFEGNQDITLQQVRDAVIAIRDGKGLLVREDYESFMSAGSFFKNPVVAPEKFREIAERVQRVGGCADWAWPLDSGKVKMSAACLIQCVGYTRGFRKDNVGISPKHTLIIINYGGATAWDVVGFAGEVQQKVKDEFGVTLRPEIRLVGFSSPCLEMSEDDGGS